MPRLTNTVTGVVVNVDEGTASTLSADWVPVEGKSDSTEKKPQARQTRRKN